MSIQVLEENKESVIREIVDKVDEVFTGYEQRDIIGALITLTTWCIVDMHLNTGQDVESMVNLFREGLSESTKIQLAKEKEVLN